MTRGSCIAAALAACLWPRAGAAQAAVRPALTMEDAVREAIDHNLTLAAERYSLAVADARTITAGLRPNPVFTYNAMLPDSAIYQSNVNPLENVFRTDWIFERGGKREYRMEVAEQARSVAELQLRNTLRTVVLDVQGAFVDVVLARDNLALAHASLDAFNRVVQVNVERARTGDLATVELARSRLAALQFQNDVRQQESRLAIALNHLKVLLGRGALDDVDVTGSLRHDATPVDVQAVLQRARDARPDLQALRRDQARSLADIRLQLAQGTVDYTLSGEFHRQHAPLADGNQYGIYFSVPLPLFNRNQGEVARARQETLQADARIHAAEAEVSGEVQAAYQAYAASRDVVTTIETQMLDQARDVRVTTEYSYRHGEASFIEFLDAVRTFNETMQSYNSARADYARSLYALEASSGESVAGLSLAKVNP